MTDRPDDRNPRPDESSPPSLSIRRREVLLAGSALALVPGWAFAGSAIAETDPAGERTAAALSVGYLLGSDGFAPPRFPVQPAEGDEDAPAQDGGVVVPAVSLAAGDPRLAGGGALIRLQGLYPTAAAERGGKGLPDDLRLDVLVRDETGVVHPFYAWSYRRGSGAAPPIRFRSWLDEEDPLVVRIEHRSRRAGRPAGLAGAPARGTAATPAPSPPEKRLRAALTLGTEGGLPRLQAGVYFLGLEPGIWDVERTLPGPGEPEATGLLSVVMTVESVPADA